MSDTVEIKFKKLHPEARTPTRSYEAAAGWDLYALRPVTLEPGAPTIVEVGVAVEIPEGYFGWVVGRSSTSRAGWAVLPGIIDSDYRGEIGPRVIKLSEVEWCTDSGHGGGSYLTIKEPDVVDAGDRVAQLLILPHVATKLVVAGELSETDRGDKGHGSTGK